MQVDYFQELGEFVFISMMWVSASVFMVGICILIMHFLMPKAVLDTYFKPPYFNQGECLLFTGIPYAPMRTIMLMRVIASPASGKKRGITKADQLVPEWYIIASKVIVRAIYVTSALLILCVVVLGFMLIFV